MKGARGVPVRLRFTKQGPVRFISHRDVARAFERAFRIGRVPLAFTQGFAPRPKVSFGLALPTGDESDAEYLDVELTDEVDPDRLAAETSADLPEGMEVTGAVFLEPRAASLQQAVTSVSYLVNLARPGDGTWNPSDVGSWAYGALQAETLPVVLRRQSRQSQHPKAPNGEVIDLRPAIRDLRVADPTGECVSLQLEVSTQPRNVRPSDLMAALSEQCGASLAAERTRRIEQWIERDGSRLTPLEADTRPRAEVGAR